MHNILQILKSTRLSLALLITLLPLIAATSIIPQKGKESPAAIESWNQANPVVAQIIAATSLDHLYTSWWFLSLFTVLFLNMTLITWQLIGKTRRKSQGLHRFTGEAPDYFSFGLYPATGDASSSFERSMKSSGYSVLKIGGELYCRKGWLGIWGGTVLHIGLVIILAGAVVSGLTRYSGYVEIGEGQTVYERDETYIDFDSGLLFPGHLSEPLTFTLTKTEHNRTGKIDHILSTLSIQDENNEAMTKTIRVNAPFSYKNFKIYQSRYSGPAILFSIISPSGTNAGYINLQNSGSNISASSLFTIPGTPLQAYVEHQNNSKELTIEVREQKKLLYRGPMQENQILDLGTHTIILLGINWWVGFIVVYDWGVQLIFTGFWFSVLGIAMMALFDPKEIWLKKSLTSEKPMIEIIGWGRWKHMFHEELNTIIEGVREWQA